MMKPSGGSATVAVRYLEEYPGSFEGAVLCAPMLRIKTGKCPRLFAEWLADWFVFTGRETCYAAGQSGFDFKAEFCRKRLPLGGTLPLCV